MTYSSFFCRKKSFIDAAFFKKAGIQNGILTYRRHKTGQLLHVKIIKQINELFYRYSTENSPYLFPIITNPDSDERKQYEVALRRINNALKTIAEMIKLSIPLTKYISRYA